jgi:hypothetical protein
LAFSQIKISAGHEFILSTDPKYSEIGDATVIFVDYVRTCCSWLGRVI